MTKRKIRRHKLDSERAAELEQWKSDRADYRAMVDEAINAEFALWLEQDVPQNPGVLDLVYRLLDTHAVRYEVEGNNGKEIITIDRAIGA